MTADGVCRLTVSIAAPPVRAAMTRYPRAPRAATENTDDRRFVVDDEDKVAVSHDGPEG